MKTTKTIEITLCDVCGIEKRNQDWPCSRCKRDICQGCEEHFYIDMRHISRDRNYQNGMMGSSSSHIELGDSKRVCKDCAVAIVEGLKELGLVGKTQNQVEKFMAVMD
jgi:hypothetical protein